MRLLVLGGTWFVGYAVAAEAVAAGWDVAVFNRGLTGSPPAGVRVINGDRAKAGDIDRVAKAGPWDAVVDTSGYVPVNVQAVARALESTAARYVFMSTVSVYEGWPMKALTDDSPTLYCPPDAGPDYGEDVEDGHSRYGFQKSGCEVAVKQTFGSSRSTLLRPGVVLGPREYVGRLPWWLRRIERGGRVVAPGDPGRRIQPVDVRDLAAFALTCVKESHSGSFNVTSSRTGTFGGMLSDCATAVGAEPELVWIPDETLVRLGVRQWSELPLWRTHAGVWNVDAGRALAAGLTCRPLESTVRDTWTWMQHPDEVPDENRAAEIGLSAERERMVLAAVS